MPQLDPSVFAPQLVWLAITFILLYCLMTWVALPQIGKAIDRRRDQIATDLREAQRMRTESEAVRAAYERALVEARAEAQAMLRETLERLTADANERQREATAKLAKDTEAAEARIAAARTAALGDVRTIAVEVAGATARRLIGGDADEAKVGAAVDAALRERA
ncbi:MAG TPA: F0F1 ATP synthase subunit B' [Stellaceae bacterium]|nr:F0F1 ATP synthase subunit B' [Stellaceae bacterium]